MAKTWVGWTEKRWREVLKWHLTSHQFTTGSKAAQCYRWRRALINANDWETLPTDIKYNIQVYAFLHEKYGGGIMLAEREKHNDGEKENGS